MNDDEGVEHRLTDLEHAFALGAIGRDQALVESLLAPEFIGVDPRGNELTRADVLADLSSPARQIESLQHERIRVRCFGDCAVVFGVTVMTWRQESRSLRGEFPYMRVWIRRDGRWLAVATHSSTAAAR